MSLTSKIHLSNSMIITIGPSWSPIQNILSTLRSIQSLMTEHPYHNEPGFEKTKSRKRKRDDVQKNVNDYNEMIIHETLRVAVIEMLQENSPDASEMPAFLKKTMITHFKAKYQFYENLIRSKQGYDGQPIRDPHSDLRPQRFMYRVMLENLLKLKEKFRQIENNVNLLEESDLSDLSIQNESESDD